MFGSIILSRGSLSRPSANESSEGVYNSIVRSILLFTFTWPLIPTGSFYSNYTNVFYYLPVGFVLNYFYGHKLK